MLDRIGRITDGTVMRTEIQSSEQKPLNVTSSIITMWLAFLRSITDVTTCAS